MVGRIFVKRHEDFLCAGRLPERVLDSSMTPGATLAHSRFICNSSAILLSALGQCFGLSNLETVSFELFFLVRRTIAKSTWAEIRTAYASGIGLREIARNMNLPEGTVLARAKREGWTRQIDSM
jgi:hypothetical protein